MWITNSLYWSRSPIQFQDSYHRYSGLIASTEAHDFFADYAKETVGIQIPKRDYSPFYLKKRYCHRIGKAIQTQMEIHKTGALFESWILRHLGKVPFRAPNLFWLLQHLLLYGDGVYMQRFPNGFHHNTVPRDEWETVQTKYMNKVHEDIQNTHEPHAKRLHLPEEWDMSQ